MPFSLCCIPAITQRRYKKQKDITNRKAKKSQGTCLQTTLGTGIPQALHAGLPLAAVGTSHSWRWHWPSCVT
jgi:hypothetical protein